MHGGRRPPYIHYHPALTNNNVQVPAMSATIVFFSPLYFPIFSLLFQILLHSLFNSLDMASPPVSRDHCLNYSNHFSYGIENDATYTHTVLSQTKTRYNISYVFIQFQYLIRPNLNFKHLNFKYARFKFKMSVLPSSSARCASSRTTTNWVNYLIILNPVGFYFVILIQNMESNARTVVLYKMLSV